MTTSLRLRLTLIILLPLMAIGALIGALELNNARATAAEVFDRSLLSAVLAISADVERTNGNALSVETANILADTSGGKVFYHVFAPDGIYVLGYATPPVPRGARATEDAEIIYYDGRYHSRDVRVLRFRSETTVDGVSGPFTYTVWQDVAVRNAFVRDLVLRTFTVIAILIGSVALVVWFGVGLGLRPLVDLEDAISARSSDDLRPIRRAVPPETKGLVTRLNSLLQQVETAMTAQTMLISNAAHQLRNPIAGVLAMAEAVRDAPNETAIRSRATELFDAARQASDLANKLLTLERIRAAPPETLQTTVDMAAVASTVAGLFRKKTTARGIDLRLDLVAGPTTVTADNVMVQEAIANLVDNAMIHGGAGLQNILISLRRQEGMAVLSVEDDGVGLAASDVATVLARFGQATPGDGSGLGLSIAAAVADRHGGRLDIDTERRGLAVRLILPLA